ncbi:MAG: dfp [Pedosphaera sp.]|nr:dfp [Pedosphaera sp.]
MLPRIGPTGKAERGEFSLLFLVQLGILTAMNCVVTAGPTHENLDEVRRLTNFSTGRLGSELADFLTTHGHQVTLLLGQQATYRAPSKAHRVEMFSTTADLRERLQTLARQPVDAVFHAAAVSDFTFGKIWVRSPDGQLTEARSGKISTRQGTLLAELLPTPKLIAELRGWYPQARLVGWKYEVDGDRVSVLALAERQITECRTTACVANGRAYGPGFGLVKGVGMHLPLRDSAALFAALEELLR